MKPKYITPENYQQFKPSELVHSFISDIEVAERIGKPMDLKEWESTEDCLPCLGGTACLNWGISVMPEISKIGDFVSELGNDIRSGYDIRYALHRLYPDLHIHNVEIEPKGIIEFDSNLKVNTHRGFTALKHQVMLYVKELEKHGL